MKLSTKLVGSMVLLISLTVLFLSVVGVFTIRNNLEAEIGKTQLQLTESTLAKIDQLLFERVQDIKAMADDERFEGLLAGRYAGEESQEKLQELLLNTGPWYVLEIFSKDGIIVASIEKDELGSSLESHDPAEIPAFTTALDGEMYISDVFVSDERMLQTMIFAAPIRDGQSVNNPIIGVIIGSVAWPVVIDILDSVKDYDIYLLNRQGEEIALSSATRKFPSSNFEQLELFEILQEGPHFGIHDQGIRNPEEVLTTLAKEQGHINYPGNEWSLVLEQPTRTAFSSITIVTQRFLLAAILIILLGVLIALLIARTIIRPIKELTKAADSISKGNLDVPIVVKTQDEIGKLAESFSFMRASLKAVIKQYESMLQKTKKTVPVKKAKVPRVKKKQGAKPAVQKQAVSPEIQKEESNQDQQKSAVQPEEKKNPSSSSK
jgi:HAMP domain-containing protein